MPLNRPRARASLIGLLLCLCVGHPVFGVSEASGASGAGRAVLEEAEALCTGTGGARDLEAAPALFVEAAESGDAVAQFRLAALRFLGTCGFSQEPDAAAKGAGALLSEVEAMAESDPYAQYLVGLSRLIGLGIAKDPPASLPWLERAAAGGEVWAAYNLGWMYSSATGVAEDLTLGMDWYEKAAERGHTQSLEITAGAYLGRYPGRKPDFEKARVLFERAAAAGARGAMTRLGEMYANGRGGLEENVPAAIEWYREAAALGESLAMYHLAFLHFHGRGVPQ